MSAGSGYGRRSTDAGTVRPREAGADGGFIPVPENVVRVTTVDHATVQYSAAPALTVYGVEFQVNVTHLPLVDGDWHLLPLHTYFHRDHTDDKLALQHRNTGEGTHAVAASYMNDPDLGDTERGEATEQSTGRWLRRTLGLTYHDDAAAVAFDGSGDGDYLGRATDVPETELLHVDVMSELQYEGDRPAFGGCDRHANRLILDWVHTDEGRLRPIDALDVDDRGDDGEFARIGRAEDGAGRFWHYCYAEL